MKAPKGWKIEPLAWAVSSLESGVSETGEDRQPVGGEAAVLKTSAVTTGVFRSEQCKVISHDVLGRARTSVKGGCVLVNRANGSAALVGISVYVSRPHPNRYLSDKIWQLAANPERTNGRYLGLITSFPRFRDEVLNRSSGGTGMRNIGSGHYLNIKVFFPPLSEQQKITEILSTWDDALQTLERLIAAKDRRRRTLMQRLLFGRTRLRKYRSGVWRTLRMSDALQRVFRPAPKTANPSLALVSVRRRFGGLFRRPDILAADYKTQDLHALVAGDFLISKRQVVHGAWAFVEPEFAGTLVSKEYAILTLHNPQALDMRFFAWLAQTPQMVQRARVSSTGVHIEKLIFDPEVFLKEVIRVPGKVAEQVAIADILDAAEAELRLLRRQHAALANQKRGLMQLLLTGRKRVRV